MKNFKRFVVGIIVLMVGTLFSFAINTVSSPLVEAQVTQETADVASQKTNCLQFVEGTYLTTASTPPNVPSFRELLTFSLDGNFFATDSNESGVPGTSNPAEQPFGDTRGRWKCVEAKKISAFGLNFDYPSGTLPAAITRAVYSATFNDNGAVQGTLTLTFFPQSVNLPLNGNQGAIAGPFTVPFTGMRIDAN